MLTPILILLALYAGNRLWARRTANKAVIAHGPVLPYRVERSGERRAACAEWRESSRAGRAAWKFGEGGVL
jgi:hypothetical protein